MSKFVGLIFDGTQTTEQIAALILTDVEAAVKDGTLPVAKYSVASSGSSIDIRVMDTPFKILNAVYYTQGHSDDLFCYNEEAHDLLTKLEAIMDSYNWDDSDIVTDSANVKFDSQVSFDINIGIRERDELLEKRCA